MTCVVEAFPFDLSGKRSPSAGVSLQVVMPSIRLLFSIVPVRDSETTASYVSVSSLRLVPSIAVDLGESLIEVHARWRGLGDCSDAFAALRSVRCAVTMAATASIVSFPLPVLMVLMLFRRPSSKNVKPAVTSENR